MEKQGDQQAYSPGLVLLADSLFNLPKGGEEDEEEEEDKNKKS